MSDKCYREKKKHGMGTGSLGEWEEQAALKRVIRKRFPRTFAWIRIFAGIQLDNHTMPGVQNAFRKAVNTGVINFASLPDNGAAFEHVLMTVFLTLTVATNPHSEVKRALRMSLSASFMESHSPALLLLPFSWDHPISPHGSWTTYVFSPRTSGHPTPPQTVLSGMEFSFHSLPLSISCLLLQIVNNFLEEERREWGGRWGGKRKRRKRKETSTMTVCNEMCQSLSSVRLCETPRPSQGNGYPLQYSCLEIPRTEKPTGGTVHSVAKS